MVGGISSLLNTYYTGTGGGVSGTSQIFDYKAAQKETQKLIDSYKENTSQVQTLKKESADFLKQYTNSMNATGKAAGQLTGGGVDKLLFDNEGKVTDETVKATVDAVQEMVDAHNSSLKLLNDNADRGPGVTKQMARMVDNPAAEASMEMVGVTVNKDGTLALDAEKMTAALKSETPGQAKLFADIIGGANGIAAGVQQDARAGLNTSAGSLINNDIAKMQNILSEDPIRSFAQSMKGAGAYAFNNMAAAGILMNMTA